MIERRRDERYELPMAVAVEYTANGECALEETELFNISLSGAYLPLRAPVEMGTRLFLHFPEFDSNLGLGGKTGKPLKVKIQGRVVRLVESINETKPRCVAVEFDGPLRIIANRDTPTFITEDSSNSIDC